MLTPLTDLDLNNKELRSTVTMKTICTTTPLKKIETTPSKLVGRNNISDNRIQSSVSSSSSSPLVSMTPLAWKEPVSFQLLNENIATLRECLSIQSSPLPPRSPFIETSDGNQDNSIALNVDTLGELDDFDSCPWSYSPSPTTKLKMESKKDTVATSTPSPNIDFSFSKLYIRWTEEEDALLRHAILQTGGGPPYQWKGAAKFFEGHRTETQCRCRWRRLMSIKRKDLANKVLPKRSPTTTSTSLSTIITTKGAPLSTSASSESAVAPPLPLSESDTSQGVSQDISVADDWTDDDKVQLLELLDHIGYNWDVIASYFPGKSIESCQTAWVDVLKQRNWLEQI